MLDDPNDDIADDEANPEVLWREIVSLRRRLELRAVENRQLVVALDTIGMCAHAQGRRFTIAIVAVADEGLRLNCTSTLVADAAGDEEALRDGIVAALADSLAALAEARTIAPVAENLLEVLADLDADEVLEGTYGVDPESDHEDVESSTVPPLEAAIYEWRRSGYPITVGQAPAPGEGWEEPEPVPAGAGKVVPIRWPGGKGEA
jgi:hypothetical protein